MGKPAENEGFRVLDELVCDAIPGEVILPAPLTRQGKNEGMRVVEELVFGAGDGGKTAAE
jgi:hypothetical protein